MIKVSLELTKLKRVNPPKIKAKTNIHGDSTDDEEMDDKVQTIFKANEKAVRKKMRKLETEEGTKQDIHNATLNFIGQAA